MSVLTPLLNPDRGFFRGMVASVLHQSFGDLEHVIIEDPPTRSECDGVAEEVVAEFGDPRVRLIRNRERSSQVLQRNRAIAEARGAVVVWIDADDLCETTRVAEQAEFLESNPGVSVVGCCPTIIDQADRTTGYRPYPLDHDAIARMMPLRNPICHPSVAARTSVLREAGGYRDDFSRCEDYDLWCRLIAAGHRFANLAKPLIRYRVHPGQIKSEHLREQLNGTLALKRRHFPSNRSVGYVARRLAERGLLWLPSELVYQLFMRTHVASAKTD